MLNRYLFVGLLAVVGCKKDEKTAPADKPADPAAAAKTADKPADKPADPAATPPADPAAAKPADPATPDKPAEPAAPAEVKWETFTSKEGGFSMEFPAKAEERDQGGMKILGAEFGTTASDSRTSMCGGTAVKLPADAKLDVPKMLEGAVARHKQPPNKVIEEKSIKLGKHPGKSIIVENTSHRKWMRVFVADKTLYVLTCGGPFDRASTDGPIATRVLDSFKIEK